MRLFFTLTFLLFSFCSYTQKLTGIWRGYFVQTNFNDRAGEFINDKYKFEVQINQLNNNSLEGVTYSYKTTVFYGKAMFHGIFKKETKNVLIKELKMLELKTIDSSDACAMTCYLDYSKVGESETLSGTFTSLTVKEKADCGEGSVFLEKVTTTDFKKESFLLKKEKSNPNKASSVNKSSVTTLKKDAANLIKKPPINKSGTNIKPGTKAFVLKKKTAIKTDTLIKKMQPDTIVKQLPLITKKIAPKIFTTPKILIDRENSLMKTIEIDENEVQIDYYDNGIIDNDTITVYHNNELVINKGRLSYDPITLKIHLDENHATHEIITVADNLGDVPPNTALMVITAGKKRYEVFITSDEKTNAKVVLEYKAKMPVKVH